MIQLMGFLVSFYVFMRGWMVLADAGEATHKTTYIARCIIGLATSLGGMAFFILFAVANIDPTRPMMDAVNELQVPEL